MVSEWKHARVGDLLSLIPGYAFKSSDFREAGAPVIKIKNVKANSIVLENLSYVDTSFLNTKREKVIQNGDILITMSGNRFGSTKETWVGKVAQFHIPGEYLLNQRVGILRPKDGIQIDKRCLSYILGSDPYQYLFISIATSSGGQANLSPNQILDSELLLPPLPEQRAIAHILGSLDDKIKLNHSMNKTLEAMARAIFKSWFVDFDPVHAKAEGRPTGLPDDIAALFPDSFEESKMGKTPKGWKVKRLNQIADFFNGLACQKYPPKEGEKSLPVIKIRELRQGITENTDKAASDVPGSYIVEDGDVLFSWSGSLLLDIWTQGRGVLNQHIFKVTSENYPKWLCYYWTNYHLTEFQRIAADKATTMGHIKRKHLNDANCCVADKKIIRKADEQIAPLFMLRIQNELEAKQLASLRDTLLPKLISGELRVPDAEKLVEKVGLQQVSLEQ